ncbi:bifunctional 2-polyprenyl-6-hydroxyphenol methylase/3-demethylubiquinol 3-O-methyltransferase UbiG [Asticcacaulis sp. EMRT-3]|uniref:bifunctional 2-polyprenyl-6-hydroxyphenol methylase/3-demethylubiquinol 3-O-methyltransferase UbiG n=1 Tax=Asticcacaulis sp. EMRT-3 TaxID=3040349 RepID=UPI0024AEE3B4|nr:bifunctional 2-polyprenyl-6-hydroxyphenol methylase/3-demethylubiquinol 3-O-methyltransferase UbiG [Asticcacaulis sp. EMRT-3]MDI7775329.1 bifunctional 2-polyprenyl-6-hydroxyphenol methylase/3-demethylubiquinol 3-O-methyltransferase UbiG [Asticcacaulis sp. EMRT-3]
MSENPTGSLTDEAPAHGDATGFSIDAREVEQFSALAAKWWDTKGAFAPLHKFNPTRVKFIRETCLEHFSLAPRERAPFTGLHLLDVGCGGGLLSEPMHRMGFNVTGLDASARNIGTAKAHADSGGLDIRYLNQTVEQLAANGETLYDVVLTMEVIEHVADPEAFLKVCASLVKPGGILFVATLNRTLKAHALAIVGAEYVLRWVPKGTHDWKKFLKPAEIHGFLADTRLKAEPAVGVSYHPLTGQWALSEDTDVNYMVVATYPASAAF